MYKDKIFKGERHSISAVCLLLIIMHFFFYSCEISYALGVTSSFQEAMSNPANKEPYYSLGEMATYIRELRTEGPKNCKDMIGRWIKASPQERHLMMKKKTGNRKKINLDNYIFHQGSGVHQAASEVISNAIDSYEQESIGQFGMGFFQLLSLLDKPEKYVKYETIFEDNTGCYKDTMIFFRDPKSESAKNSENIVFTYRREAVSSQDIKCGTKVTVKDADSIQGLEESIRKKYCYFNSIPIYINNHNRVYNHNLESYPKEKMDTNKNATRVNINIDTNAGEYTVSDNGTGIKDMPIKLLSVRSGDKHMSTKPSLPRIKYTLFNDSDTAKLSLTLKNVTVKTVILENTLSRNLPRELSLDLSKDTPITEERLSIALKEDQVNAIIQFMRQISRDESVDVKGKIQMLNGIATLIENTTKSNLRSQQIKKRIQEALEPFIKKLYNQDYKPIHNTQNSMHILGTKLQNVLFFHPFLFVPNPSRLGFQEATVDAVSAPGHRLFFGNLGQGKWIAMGKSIIFDKETYDLYKQKGLLVALFKGVVDIDMGYDQNPDRNFTNKLLPMSRLLDHVYNSNKFLPLESFDNQISKKYDFPGITGIESNEFSKYRENIQKVVYEQSSIEFEKILPRKDKLPKDICDYIEHTVPKKYKSSFIQNILCSNFSTMYNVIENHVKKERYLKSIYDSITESDINKFFVEKKMIEYKRNIMSGSDFQIFQQKIQNSNVKMHEMKCFIMGVEPNLDKAQKKKKVFFDGYLDFSYLKNNCNLSDNIKFYVSLIYRHYDAIENSPPLDLDKESLKTVINFMGAAREYVANWSKEDEEYLINRLIYRRQKVTSENILFYLLPEGMGSQELLQTLEVKGEDPLEWQLFFKIYAYLKYLKISPSSKIGCFSSYEGNDESMRAIFDKDKNKAKTIILNITERLKYLMENFDEDRYLSNMLKNLTKNCWNFKTQPVSTRDYCALDSGLTLIFDKMLDKNKDIPDELNLLYYFFSGQIIKPASKKELNIPHININPTFQSKTQFPNGFPLEHLIQATNDLSLMNNVKNSPGQAQALETFIKSIKSSNDYDLSSKRSFLSGIIRGQSDAFQFLRELLQNSRDAYKSTAKHKSMPVPYTISLANDSDDDSDLDDIYGYSDDDDDDAAEKAVEKIEEEKIENSRVLGDSEPGKKTDDARVDIFDYIDEEKKEYIIGVVDYVGIPDVYTIVNYLLNPDSSNKHNHSENLIGKFGKGFFTAFHEASEVRITTGRDGQLNQVVLGVSHVSDGNIRITVKNFTVGTPDSNNPFEGTVIEWVKQYQNAEDIRLGAGFDALCFQMALQKYVSPIPKSDIQVYYKDKEINGVYDDILSLPFQFADQEGFIRVSEYNESSTFKPSVLTVDGFHLDTISEKPPLLQLVPRPYLKVLLDRGLKIDLPNNIPITSSRVAIKDSAVPNVQAAIARTILAALMKLYLEKNISVPGIPVDLLWINDKSYLRETVPSSFIKSLISGNYDAWKEIKQNEMNLQYITTILLYLPVIQDDTGNWLNLHRIIKTSHQEPKDREVSLSSLKNIKLEFKNKLENVYAKTKQEEESRNKEKIISPEGYPQLLFFKLIMESIMKRFFAIYGHDFVPIQFVETDDATNACFRPFRKSIFIKVEKDHDKYVISTPVLRNAFNALMKSNTLLTKDQFFYHALNLFIHEFAHSLENGTFTHQPLSDGIDETFANKMRELYQAIMNDLSAEEIDNIISKAFVESGIYSDREKEAKEILDGISTFFDLDTDQANLKKILEDKKVQSAFRTWKLIDNQDVDDEQKISNSSEELDLKKIKIFFKEALMRVAKSSPTFVTDICLEIEEKVIKISVDELLTVAKIFHAYA